MKIKPETSFSLDETLRELYEQDDLPGISAVVSLRGAAMWTKSYGFANLENGQPAGSRTIYHLGSLTKVFTALWLLQLRDDGVLQLEDPLAKFLPEAREAGLPPITLQQLASHTSGLPLMPPLDSLARAMQEFPPRMETLESLHFPSISEILAALPLVELEADPGEQIAYSNLGVALLARALEKASGQEYTAAIQARMLGPLGMASSGFSEHVVGRPNTAACYLPFFDPPQAAPFQTKQIGGFTPTGALWSSAGDMADFLAFLTGPESGGAARVISRQSLLEMTQMIAPLGSSRYTGAAGNAGVGIGWFLSAVDGQLLAEHGGADPSTAAYLGWLPAPRLGVFLATNSGKNPGAVAAGGAAMLKVMRRDILDSV